MPICFGHRITSERMEPFCKLFFCCVYYGQEEVLMKDKVKKVEREIKELD